MATIAVLGTGRMGAAIARRLLHVGHEVTVWNRTVEKVGPLVAAGARAAATPAVAAADAAVVITMLTDAVAVGEVVAQLGLGHGTTLVEMSTIGPAAVRELPLPAGVRVVDAPVLGSVAAAAAGKLTILAGGDVDPVRSVLAALGTVRECGPLGSGAAMKLVANTALVTGLAALADTIAVARSLGVDAESALSVVARGALAGAVTRATSPGAAFPIALAAKDLALALEATSTFADPGEQPDQQPEHQPDQQLEQRQPNYGATAAQEERHAGFAAGAARRQPGSGAAAIPLVRASAGVLRGAPDPHADLGTIVLRAPA